MRESLHGQLSQFFFQNELQTHLHHNLQQAAAPNRAGVTRSAKHNNLIKLKAAPEGQSRSISVLQKSYRNKRTSQL